MAFKDTISQIKENLKKQLTADNTQVITDIDKQVDSLLIEYEELDKKNSDLKDKLIDYVKNTSFKEPAKDLNPNEGDPLSIEDAIKESINELNKNKGGK